MSKNNFTSKRADYYADIPDEKWNNWRWQLSNRINTPEEFEKVFPLTDSEREALSAAHLFRVDITPYYASLINPDDSNDPIRKQVVPTAGEMVPSSPWIGAPRPGPSFDVSHNPMRLLLPILHAFTHCWRSNRDVFA
jgi:L-lysine 2,3-aminomutase